MRPAATPGKTTERRDADGDLWEDPFARVTGAVMISRGLFMYVNKEQVAWGVIRRNDKYIYSSTLKSELNMCPQPGAQDNKRSTQMRQRSKPTIV